MIILIAGPYRTGTNDDPIKISENLAKLEQAALVLWNKGHMPFVAEWFSLPLIRRFGSQNIGDDIWQSFAYPVADRLIGHSDAVLRLPGKSKGADGDVARAKTLGLPVYFDLVDIPNVIAHKGNRI